MLDGVFNPPPKSNIEDLVSDEDDDDMEANASERNTETENVEMESETNIESIRVNNKTLSEPNVSSSTHGIVFIQGESNTTTLETNQTTQVSPSVLNIPTTFGSENITSHRLLRKSLNLSRNNSVDSNGTSKNDQINQPNKIRIEARIDSDKKIQNSYKNNSTGHSKTRKGLRYNIRNTNKNANDGLDGDLFSNPKPREPEIIEKILSPSKTKSASKATNDLQHTSNLQSTTRVIEGNMSPQEGNCESIQKEKPLSQHGSLRPTESNLKEDVSAEHLITINDEVNNKNSCTKITNNFKFFI